MHPVEEASSICLGARVGGSEEVKAPSLGSLGSLRTSTPSLQPKMALCPHLLQQKLSGVPHLSELWSV